MELIDQLSWRYATKRMNGESVPAEKVQAILEAIRLSASSFGLQPYSVLVIEDKDLREKIRTVAYNQPQITESSVLLVFAAWDVITEARIDNFVNLAKEVRHIEEGVASYLRNTVTGMAARSEEVNFNWMARQAYIALGTGLIAAAAQGVDACPMEGFDTAALDELLGLKEKGLKSVSLLPLGYRDAVADATAAAPKVRRAKEDLFIKL
jgi:nitroreductase / dihydropteridine reductase